MSARDTPYREQPPQAFWRHAVAGVPADDLDPVLEWPLRIEPTDRVATAGSCFAQHIARRLAASGFHYFVTEPAHPLLTAEQAREYNYGTFSARYGNVYTSRQLLQLAQRALGEFAPVDDAWQDPSGGGWLDPLRPTIQPGGFSCLEELHADRAQHLAAVRRLLCETDVLVFTLGLTECWMHRGDGTAYPLCPGVAGGHFDGTLHVFRNLEVHEVVADLRGFLDRLRSLNPRSRVILTVSPVPLAATAGRAHVLPATVYSKSVLRVAAETVQRLVPGLAYFPSYEIITSAAARGRYFAADCREVTETGVDHVMRVFFRHATRGGAVEQSHAAATRAPASDFLDAAQKVVDVICDENLIDQQAPDPVPAAAPDHRTS